MKALGISGLEIVRTCTKNNYPLSLHTNEESWKFLRAPRVWLKHFREDRCCEGCARAMNRGGPPEPLDFFIWTSEDVGEWLDEIGLGSYRQIFKENAVNGEYLDSLSTFTTEQILRFIRRCHMKWGDFITLCKELRHIKVACLKGEQEVRRPWWAPACLSIFFVKVAKHNRQSRVVSLKFDP